MGALEHALSIVSLTLGVLGSLYLSYDLLGQRGGMLRACLVGVNSAILGVVFVGLPTLLLAREVGLPAPSGVEAFLMSNGLPALYFAVGFFTGVVIYLSPHLQRGHPAPSMAAQRERHGTLLAFGGALFIVLITYLAVGGFGRSGDASYFLVYGVFLLSFVAQVPLSAWVLLRVLRWVDTFEGRQLGAFGALLTLGSFGVQLVLALR